MHQPVLAGRKVLELGSMLAAPFATHILAQLGADVIKLEPPRGDSTRSLVRGGPSGTLLAYSRGKKSLCADLRTDKGKELFKRLLADTDVLVHNLAPDSARRLNLTYEDCLEINPKLVYCHIRGYGAGPLENELASNPVAEAATGVMFSHRIDGRPSRLGPSYHDQFAGTYAVIGILSALLDSAGNKESRLVEIGLYETGLHVAARDLVGIQIKKQLTGKADEEPSGEFSMPGYGAYETADDRWIYLVMLTDGHWQKFWEAMGNPDAGDSALSTLRQRKKRRLEVENLVKSAVKRLTFEAILDRLRAAGVGCTEVVPSAKVLDAPQARSEQTLADFSFQGYEFEAPDFPLRQEFGQHGPASPPSLLGEHTREILHGLGYAPAECEALIAEGVIATPATDKPVWAPVDRQKD